MSANLIWIKPEEGRAFYTEEDKIYFLEPLYNKAVPSTELEMRTIVAREGYEQVKETFPNFKLVADYVSGQYERIRKNEGGLDIPTGNQLEEVVAGAKDELLLHYVNRAIEKWIPNGNLNGANKLYADVMQAAKIRRKPELFKAAQELHAKIKEKEENLAPIAPKSIIFDPESGELVVKANAEGQPVEVEESIYADGFCAIEPEDVYVDRCVKIFTTSRIVIENFAARCIELRQRRQSRKKSFNMIPCT